MEVQIQQAVEIASGYTNDNTLKQQALDFIQQFKASPDGWKHCITLLASSISAKDDSSISLNMKFFIFQVFDERIPFLSDEEKTNLKDAVFGYIEELISKEKVEPVFLRNAAAKTLGLLFVNCTLSCYPNLIKELLSMATQDGHTFNELATDYYLKTLVIIHQEIGDQMIIRDKQTTDRNTLLKDFIRDNDMVSMTESWKQILQHFTDPDAAIGDKALASEIIDGALMAIGFYSSWIEVNLILDQRFLTIFYQCLTSNDQKIQIRTAGTFVDILHKKMLPSKKLELINFLNLGTFLNQMQFNIKNLDFSFTQSLAKLCEQLGSECIEVLDRSSHDELKYDDFRNMAVANVLEVMPLVFRFLEYGYDDISLEVFPFLSNYLLFLKKNIVNEDLDFSALNNDQILTTLLKKIILKMKYDEEDDGDDEESIEMFDEVRSKLTSFQDSIVIINDMLSLEVMIESINEFLFQHLGGDGAKDADWRDIELGLYQLTYYSELLRNNIMNLPKTMINASKPYYVFNEMLCKVIKNSTDILLSHPLIQLLFFELIMKHYTFFSNSNIQVEGVDKSEILLKVLKIFASNFGIFSENSKVKYRSWYLFSRFIKLTRPQIDDFVITELTESLTPLLQFDFEVSGDKNRGGNLQDIDLTLVEENGSFENQLFLLEAIGVLITLMHSPEERINMVQNVLQPLFNNLEKCINGLHKLDLATLLQAHHTLVSVGTIIKGFEGLNPSQYTDKFIEILQQIAQVVLITLEQFDDYNVVREACSFCMVRLFILLSKFGSTHVEVLQDVLSKFVSITINGFDKRKMSEVVNFINFITQLFHYCSSMEPVYLLLSSLLAPLIGKVMERIELETSRAGDDFTKNDILDLQKALMSLLSSISNDNLNSMWLANDDNKQILVTVINLMLSYIYNYSTNDISLVKRAIGELNALNHGLGLGKVVDIEDHFKNDNNTFEKAGELLVANSILISIELTFKLQNKELLKDAQFRNGVLLEISRLLKTVAFIGHDIPDTNTLKKDKPKRNGQAGPPTTNTHNDMTCQQITNALINQLGYPVDAANEFVQHLISSTDRQFSKYLIGLIGDSDIDDDDDDDDSDNDNDNNKSISTINNSLPRTAGTANSANTARLRHIVDTTLSKRTGFKRSNSSSLESSDKSRTKLDFAFSDCFMNKTQPPPSFLHRRQGSSASSPATITTPRPVSLFAFEPSSNYFDDHRFVRQSPAVKIVSTDELIQFLILHYSIPLPDVDTVFPWLHGIHRNNQAQLQFLGRSITAETKYTSADANSSESSHSELFTPETTDNLEADLVSSRVPNGVRNIMVVRSCNTCGEVSSEYSDIIVESTGLIRGTVSADDILMSTQGVPDMKMYLKSVLGDKSEALGLISMDTIEDDCNRTKLLPVFKDMDPQFGVSLRNFHIQVSKVSNLSDLIVYCFNDDHSLCVDEATGDHSPCFDFSSKNCKCVSLCRLLHIAQIIYADEHFEMNSDPKLGSKRCPYNTFMVRDPSQQKMHEANLLAIPVMDTKSSLKAPQDLCSEYDLNVFNNWDSNYLYRERLEISKMSTATPISTGNVWLGNITDFECLQIRLGNGESFPQNTTSRLPSTPLYCDPQNTVVTLTKRDLDLKKKAISELDAKLITLPKTRWRLFVHCFEGATFPELSDLKALFESHNEHIEQVQLEFPPSGSFTLSDMSENDILTIVNICKLCYYRCSKHFPALLYCSDGYTETSLLTICFVMYAERLLLDDALIKLHMHYGRPFFIFRTDYLLLMKLEPILHGFSPLNSAENGSDDCTFEQDASRISVGCNVDSHYRSSRRSSTDAQSDSDSPLEPVLGSLPSRILPHLYLGSLAHACCLSLLSTLGINYIISVEEHIPWIDNLKYDTTVTESGCEVLSFKSNQRDFPSGDNCHVSQVMRINNICDDGVGTLTTTINDALEFLDKCYRNGGRVLVHCQVGVSRSATVCIAEVMRRLNVSLPRAYMFVRVRRLNVIIQPNLKLMYELFKWEEAFVRSKDLKAIQSQRRHRYSSNSSSLSSAASGSIFTAGGLSERSSISTFGGSAKIVVVGAGVVGLTTALELLNQPGANHRVTVVASQIPTDFQFSSNYTSPFAGANWMSFAAHDDIRQQNIDAVGYRRFKQLARTRPESGVKERVNYVYITNEKFAAGGNIIDLPWFSELKDLNLKLVPDYDHSKFSYAYKFDGFVISTTYYLGFLWSECAKTGRFDLQRKTINKLQDAFNLHADGVRADLVVNCSGLRARELVPDSAVYGVRGVTLLADNNINLKDVMVVETNEKGFSDEELYIMPRKEGGLVIGGCFQVNNEMEKTASDEQVQRILGRARKYLPNLNWKKFDIFRKQVGFRPFRKGGLRIEADPSLHGVIHCYGHGGAGYQASWGSAVEVVKLANNYLTSQKNTAYPHL
ncbi:hypothetical protein FOA43_001618 [Brettanomyces nanus]|uniref:Uncharacterized protein n=1 Tax=Eeniella nana TaxID=13502 RepID=A0A875S054_EENNA|nr:uncharacterized protein FOA43_001618 [Brettanomyces nanus]QPG74293.1 hypothetical protein FOA43_001618 [Brettanomyces nanus]